MQREYDDHFGAYLFVCPDWAKHIEAWAYARGPSPAVRYFDVFDSAGNQVWIDADELEKPKAKLEDFDFSQEVRDLVSCYGIIRYSALDEGDDCCPTCGNQIDLNDAVEVSEGLARKELKKRGMADLSLDAGV